MNAQEADEDDEDDDKDADKICEVGEVNGNWASLKTQGRLDRGAQPAGGSGRRCEFNHSNDAQEQRQKQ